MLYNEVMSAYGFYIFFAGGLAFLIGAAVLGILFKSSLRGLEKYMEEEITCCAIVSQKEGRRRICFEIESGEMVKLKLKQGDYDYLFEGDEGVLTYRPGKFGGFEKRLPEEGELL